MESASPLNAELVSSSQKALAVNLFKMKAKWAQPKMWETLISSVK